MPPCADPGKAQYSQRNKKIKKFIFCLFSKLRNLVRVKQVQYSLLFIIATKKLTYDLAMKLNDVSLF